MEGIEHSRASHEQHGGEAWHAGRKGLQHGVYLARQLTRWRHNEGANLNSHTQPHSTFSLFHAAC